MNRGKDKANRIYYGWVIVAASFLVIVPTTPLFSSFSIFQASILDEFHWERGSFAIAFSIYLLVSGIATPYAGGLIDRFGPRRVMPIGALITALALMLASRSSALWHFYVAYVLMAAGSSLLQIVPLTALIANWFVRYRGTAIGIVNTGSGVGQSALLPGINLFVSNIGWRHTYLWFGLTILIIPTTLIWLFLYRRPEDRGLSIEDESGRRGEAGAKPETGEENPGQGKQSGRHRKMVILDKEWAETDWTLRKARRTFRFWALGLALAFFAIGSLLIALQLPTYLKDKGYSAIIVASVISLQGVINIVGEFAGGLLSDRIGREKTLTLGLLSFGAGIVVLNLAGGVNSPTLVYAFTIFYGLGQGIAPPTLMISASDLFQGKNFGKILGLVFLGGYFGGAIGAWLSGSLIDLTGAYQVNFLASGLAMLISVTLIWKARPGGVRQVRRVPVVAHDKPTSVEAT
jgi:MFS family permease